MGRLRPPRREGRPVLLVPHDRPELVQVAVERRGLRLPTPGGQRRRPAADGARRPQQVPRDGVHHAQPAVRGDEEHRAVHRPDPRLDRRRPDPHVRGPRPGRPVRVAVPPAQRVGGGRAAAQWRDHVHLDLREVDQVAVPGRRQSRRPVLRADALSGRPPGEDDHRRARPPGQPDRSARRAGRRLPVPALADVDRAGAAGEGRPQLPVRRPRRAQQRPPGRTDQRHRRRRRRPGPESGEGGAN